MKKKINILYWKVLFLGPPIELKCCILRYKVALDKLNQQGDMSRFCFSDLAEYTFPLSNQNKFKKCYITLFFRCIYSGQARTARPMILSLN